MRSNWIRTVAFLGVAAFGLLLFSPDTALAQRRSGWRGGYNGGYNRGWDYGRGDGWRGGWDLGWGLGYPYYRGGNYGTTPYFYPSARVYPDYSYQSFYPQQYASAGPTSHITVRLPSPNAQLLLNGVATSQLGMVREFDSPPMEPGYNYSYEAKARWMDPSGKQVEQTRTVSFQPGQRVMIDFTQPGDAVAPARGDSPPSPQLSQQREQP